LGRRENKAYIYTRYGNPTLTVAQKKIAALEGAEGAIVTSSGMAAISSALLAALKPATKSSPRRSSTAARTPDARRVPEHGHRRAAGRHGSGRNRGSRHATHESLYVETPTNPTLRLVDIHKAVAFAKKHKLVSIIDNTFATPILAESHRLGYTWSCTAPRKHWPATRISSRGAAAATRIWMERVRQMIIILAARWIPGAAYLLIRGMKTLGVRVERQCENAMAVAKFLEKHSKVARVHYPGLKSTRIMRWPKNRCVDSAECWHSI